MEQKQKVILEQIDAIQMVLVDLRKQIEEFIEAPTPQQAIVETPVVKEESHQEEAPAKKETKKSKKSEVEVKVEAPVEEETQEEELEITEEMIEQTIEEYGLVDMEVAELKALLTENEVAFDKRKKDIHFLATLVAKAILEGVIPTEGDEEEETADADEKSEEVPAIAEEEESEEEVEEEDDSEEGTEEESEAEISEERKEAEEFVEEEIRKQFANKKLKASKMKAELSEYYSGDEDCSNCGGCPEEELLSCYIRMKQAFVGDDGEENEPESAYYRDEELYCCGAQCVEHPDEEGVMVCEICGTKLDLNE